MTKRPHLSKSRYLSGLQCHLKLWYDCFNRELAAPVTPDKQAIFDTGHEVGRVATGHHPGGVLIDRDALGYAGALDRTQQVLADSRVPAIFEAALHHENTQVHVDILARAPRGQWDLVEVKSATKVKEPNEDDLAVQLWVLRKAGIDVRRAAILTLNNAYTYAGGDYDLDALFLLRDRTDVATAKHDEVTERIAELHAIVDARKPPRIEPGDHCFKPYDCPYYASCTKGVVGPEHPITDLPSLGARKKGELRAAGVESIQRIPSGFTLTELQERVRRSVTTDREYIGAGLATALSEVRYPVHHVDFETFGPALPRYLGTHPYGALPFQWSNHVEQADGTTLHDEFLCRQDVDPRRVFAETLLESVGEEGSICVYTTYEKRILRELAVVLPDLARELRRVEARMWDLHDTVKRHYYHPQFHGSFSLKRVLPVLVPHMTYAGMAIADGNAAQRAYLEAIATSDPARRSALHADLLAYCGQDTLAMIELRRVLREKINRGMAT